MYALILTLVTSYVDTQDLTVVVYNKSGNAIHGASVTLNDGSGTLRKGTTGLGGGCTFTAVRLGAEVSASATYNGNSGNTGYIPNWRGQKLEIRIY
jgi:hypothetical protein